MKGSVDREVDARHRLLPDYNANPICARGHIVTGVGGFATYWAAIRAGLKRNGDGSTLRLGTDDELELGRRTRRAGDEDEDTICLRETTLPFRLADPGPYSARPPTLLHSLWEEGGGCLREVCLPQALGKARSAHLLTVVAQARIPLAEETSRLRATLGVPQGFQAGYPLLSGGPPSR